MRSSACCACSLAIACLLACLLSFFDHSLTLSLAARLLLAFFDHSLSRLLLACYSLTVAHTQRQVAAHLAKASRSGSHDGQLHRLRTICSEFVETCSYAAPDGYGQYHRDVAAEAGGGAETGGAGAGAGAAVVGGGSGGGYAADGVLGRLHECAGFVAVLTLLLQTREEWEGCKRYIVVSEGKRTPFELLI